jgi:hypothetical protein
MGIIQLAYFKSLAFKNPHKRSQQKFRVNWSASIVLVRPARKYIRWLSWY